MSKPDPRRLRSSSNFTCSRCGGHEAYNVKIKNAWERLLLQAVMVRPIQCCDCDALCVAFPVRHSNPIAADLAKTELRPEPRPAQLPRPVTRPLAKQAPAYPVHGGAAAHFYRNRLQRSTGMLPTASH